MKKKEIATALGLSVALTMTGCASNEINQIKSETTVELGSECNIEVSEYFELGSKVDSSAIVFDTSAVDTNTVGDYVITVSFKKNTYSINVSVVDTTAPILSVKENIEPVERGNSITASDYAEVDDKSDVNVFWVAEDGETDIIDIPEDLDSSVTEINYTLVAVDESGNRSEEKQVTVPIVPVVDTEFTDEDNAFEAEEPATQTTQQKEKLDPKTATADEINEYISNTLPKEEQLELTRRLVELGELTEEDYKEVEEILNDPSNFISDIVSDFISDMVPETQPTVQPSSDCGTCIASDCEDCFSVCSGNYCNVQ